MVPFMPADEDSPIMNRPKDSEYESKLEFPDIPDPSSDEDFVVLSKPRHGPPATAKYALVKTVRYPRPLER